MSIFQPKSKNLAEIKNATQTISNDNWNMTVTYNKDGITLNGTKNKTTSDYFGMQANAFSNYLPLGIGSYRMIVKNTTPEPIKIDMRLRNSANVDVANFNTGTIQPNSTGYVDFTLEDVATTIFYTQLHIITNYQTTFTNGLVQLMITSDSTATQYEPYLNPKIAHIHKTTNLLDIRSVEKGGLSASTGEPVYVQQVSSFFWHGGSVTFTTTANYRGIHFGFVKVDTNISNTLSLSSSSILTQFTTSIMCYDSDKEFIAESTRQAVSNYFRRFTLAEGTKYIRFAIGGSGGARTYTVENIMINYGMTQPAYDPYYISRVYQGENLVFSDILPDELQECEYVQSSATQYIDTGVKPNDSYGLDIQFSTIAGGSAYICGVIESDSRYLISQTASGNVIVFDIKNSDNRVISTISPVGHKTRVAIKNKGFYVDGTYFGSSISELLTQNYNAWLFGAANSYKSTSRIYYAKFYDNNNTLVRNFIPCYIKPDHTFVDVNGTTQPAGTIGLYDKVNGELYVNAGTGTFTKGRDV